jgi:hypothetical protein
MKINYDTIALPTECSGGIVSGNFFMVADNDLDFETAHADAIEAEANYEKYKIFPVGKKRRFKVLYEACEKLLKALWKVRKVQGTDEAVFLLRLHQGFARSLYNLLQYGWSIDQKLASTRKFKDITYEFFSWGGDYPGYDFFNRTMP